MTAFRHLFRVALLITSVCAVASTGRAQVMFGNYTDDAGSSVHAANFLLGQRIEVTDEINLTDVGLIVDGNNGGSAMANIGIYSDVAGQPDTLLTETGLFNLGLGDQLVPVTAEMILTAGNYWYMAAFDSTVHISQDNGVSDLTYYQAHSAGASLPSPLTSLFSYNGPEFNYYLQGDVTSGEELFGNNSDDAGSSVHGANFLLGQQISVTNDVTLTDVGLIVDGNAGGSAMANIGVYTDDGGQPGTLVAETGLFGLALGDQRVPVTSATALTAGDYWYMAVYDSVVNISQDDTTNELTYYQAHSAVAALPSPLTSLLSYTGPEFNYYLVAGDVVIPGDGNGDGWVNGLDYLLWAGNFGTHPGVDGDISDGDYNDDGWVDGLDYLLWAGNFGTHDGVAVPEPSSLLLAVFALISVVGSARSRR